jgi:hypothetical protein
VQPQLRFNKDKRGYENTYLVQPAGARRGRSRTRILYWFRTPPGIRVGRGPLDEDAIRMLEAQNPDVQFDWTRILKGQPQPDTRKAAPAEERDRGRDERGREKKRQRPQAARSAAEPQSPPTSAEPEPLRVEAGPVVEEPTSAAHARLGSEGLGRLRARYSEMLARIGERVADAERQAELKLLAERLNPDAWVTDSDVVAALEGYEATFAALRADLVPARPAAPPSETPADE